MLGSNPRGFGLRILPPQRFYRIGFQIPIDEWYIGVYPSLSSLDLQNSFLITLTPCKFPTWVILLFGRSLKAIRSVGVLKRYV